MPRKFVRTGKSAKPDQASSKSLTLDHTKAMGKKSEGTLTGNNYQTLDKLVRKASA